MTGPIYLSLVVHNHQPIGQFDYVSEHSTHVSYLPLIEALEQHPHVKVAIHYGGALLEWLRQHHGGLVSRLGALVERGQVEMLSGGYYEPALVAIPDEDKIGQIQKLNGLLEDTFHTRPTGMWLAERIWEPHLPRALSEAGVRYVILDDTHFERVGFDRTSDLFGYFVTEEQGHTTVVFPSLTYLRYAIPQEPVETLLDWLRDRAIRPESGQPSRLMLMADDGGKFGTWPGTYEHCWGEGHYIEDLFNALEMNREWLRTTTPSEYMAHNTPLGRAYLPSTSYMEMGAWSLFADDAHRLESARRMLVRERRDEVQRFLHGGLWRNFMVKYDEINHLHKRMLMVSEKVHAMRRGRKRERALDLLWAAQGNDPYWHGLFGGAYLFNLRAVAYANLIAAEDAAENEELTIRLEEKDFDCDGLSDLLVTSQTLNTIISPARGGAVMELDYRPGYHNLYNVMARRKEGYHADLKQAADQDKVITPISPAYQETLPPDAVRAKEAGLESHLHYDWHRRASFIDHFPDATTPLHEFATGRYAEQGDFVNQPYRIAQRDCDSESAFITLEREGHVWVGAVHRPVRVRKTYLLQYNAPVLHVRYSLSQTSDTPLYLRFGIETVVGFDGGQDLRYCSLRLNGDDTRLALGATQEFEGISRHCADTNLRNLTLITELSRPAFLWQFPLETITLSEAGFERTYQGTVFLHFWNMQLEPNETWEVNLVQTVQQTATR